MPQMRLLVAVEPVDFRNGIDGLVAVCRQRLQADPMSGAVFVFGSRNRKSIKLLVYDGQGFLLCQKRLSAGRFGWWPKTGEAATQPLEVHQLQLLLWNGDLQAVKIAPLWRPLATTVA
jgi:transposase